jgi:hypothetical protein
MWKKVWNAPRAQRTYTGTLKVLVTWEYNKFGEIGDNYHSGLREIPIGFWTVSSSVMSPTSNFFV